MIELKMLIFFRTQNIQQHVSQILTNKEKKKLQEKRKALHFNTVSRKFFFQEKGSHFHFVPDLEVFRIKPSSIEVIPVVFCQILLLASLSQTAFPSCLPIKFYAAVTTLTAGMILLVWFTFKHGTKVCVFGISREFTRVRGICSFLELTI